MAEGEINPPVELVIRDLPHEALVELGAIATRLGGTVAIQNISPAPESTLPDDLVVSKTDFSTWSIAHGFTKPGRTWEHLSEKSRDPKDPMHTLIHPSKKTFSLKDASRMLGAVLRTDTHYPLGSIAALSLASMVHAKIAENLPEAPRPKREPLLDGAAVYDTTVNAMYGEKLGIKYTHDLNLEAIDTLGQKHVASHRTPRRGRTAMPPFVVSYNPFSEQMVVIETMELGELETQIVRAQTVPRLFQRNVRSLYVALKYTKALRQQGVHLGAQSDSV